MACYACRTCVWLVWFALAIITGTYAALSLVSFSNIYTAYEDDNTEDSKQLRAILATTIFGSFLVAAFTVASFFILLGKTVLSSGAGFGYGVLLASTLHMAVTSLLCALVMHGFEDEIEEELEKVEKIDWGGMETSTYKSTWSFAYISAGVYLFFFLWLFFSPRAFQREERVQDEKNADA